TIKDGTSNSLMFSEVLPFDQPLDAPSATSPSGRNRDWRGCVLLPGPGGNMFTTNVGPNSSTPDNFAGCDTRIPAGYANNLQCTQNRADGNTWGAARSAHTGGVNVSMCDGSVRFVTNNISLTTWSAVGTIRGSEVLGGDF